MKPPARTAAGPARPAGGPRPYVPRKTMYELPPLELECMKMLWALGEATVRDIREQLAAARRALAYTTVETIMDRLTRKGAVVRRKVGRAHRYTPVYEKARARAQAVEALLEHFFEGSRQALAAHLSGGTVSDSRRAVLAPPPARMSPASRRPAATAVGRRAPEARESKPQPPIDISLL